MTTIAALKIAATALSESLGKLVQVMALSTRRFHSQRALSAIPVRRRSITPRPPRSRALQTTC